MKIFLVSAALRRQPHRSLNRSVAGLLAKHGSRRRPSSRQRMVGVRSELKIPFDYKSVTFEAKATCDLVASGTELRRFAYHFDERRPYHANSNCGDTAMTI